MSIDHAKIRIKAMGVIRRGQGILVSPVTDTDGTVIGYRLPGGGVDFGETSIDTLIREFAEEFGAELREIELLDVLENVFTYRGTPGHEVVFIYAANFADTDLYEQDELIIADAPDANPCIWLDPDEMPDGTDIFPAGTLKVLGY